MCGPDLNLALAIVDLFTSNEHDGMMNVLLSLLDSRDLTAKLLKAMVSKEITDTGA